MMLQGKEVYAVKMCECWKKNKSMKAHAIKEILEKIPKLSDLEMSPIVNQIYIDIAVSVGTEPTRRWLSDLHNCQLYWILKEVGHLYDYRENTTDISLGWLVLNEKNKNMPAIIKSKAVSKDALVLFVKYLLETRMPGRDNVSPAFLDMWDQFDMEPFYMLAKFEWEKEDVLKSYILELLNCSEKGEDDDRFILNQLDGMTLGSLQDNLYCLAHEPEFSVEPEVYVEVITDIASGKKREEFYDVLREFDDEQKENIITNLLRVARDFDKPDGTTFALEYMGGDK